MAEKPIMLEQEVQRALDCIKQKKNFILTGGAGSGKTYSLVSLIEQIGIEYPEKYITCITYTNNAVSEIRSRITNTNLNVSTIHEFIWSVIFKYQNELKAIIVELVNDNENTLFKRPTELTLETALDMTFFGINKIEYDEYYSLKSDKNSKISHDHVLIVAERMFERYPKLCDILKDTSNFIFIDEYQDTSPLIVKIFTKHIKQSSKDCVIGFFGDSMQAIYDEGVGSIEDESFIRIDKIQNRRNPFSVIELANKLRDDGIVQKASDDNNAPNMLNGTVIDGSARFITIEDLNELDELKKSDLFNEWNFNNGIETKELYLTHKFNAKQAGFKNLYELYNNDLIYELITKIKTKISSGDITSDSKTFESLVNEAKISKGSVKNKYLLIDKIHKCQTLSNYYNELKLQSWDSISNNVINKDSLLSYKFNGLLGVYEAKPQRDPILRRLDIVFELIDCYQNKEYNQFLRKTKFKVKNFNDKKRIYDDMKQFENIDEKTIGEILDLAISYKIIHGDENFNMFLESSGKYLWSRIRNIKYIEYVNSIEYQKEHLPFATQHSIKGSEYNKVLVVLDNGKWSKYDFKTLFGVGSNNSTVNSRTKKIFYVCCTRAKKDLVVVMPTEKQEIISEANKLFGEENVFEYKNHLFNHLKENNYHFFQPNTN